MVAWALLCTVLAVVAVVACAVNGSRRRGGPKGFVLVVGIASLVLIALVAPEFGGRVQYDMASFVGVTWGAIVGLGLAVSAAAGAWFAWATLQFPHLWGLEPTGD